MLAFAWSLSDFGRAGWAVSFLFVICGALRLARFNLQSKQQDRRFFVGMPIPAAACIVAATIYAHPNPPEPGREPFISGMVLVLVMLVSFLMVSRVRYRSFKDLDLRRRRSYLYLLIPAAVLAMVALHPPVALMLAGYLYLLSGILPRRALRQEQALGGAIAASGAGSSGPGGRGRGDDGR